MQRLAGHEEKESMMSAMTDSELKSILTAEIADSLAHLGGELSEQRRKALRYYLGEPFGNEQEGRSKVVSTDVADVVAWYNDAQWTIYGDGDGGFATAYESPTSFSVTGVDVTAVYHAGRRIKATGPLTGTIYGTIQSSVFSINTTVTVAWDSGSLQNETLTIAIGILSAANSAIPAAGTGAPGAVQLATQTETETGTSTAKAVTPGGLAPASMTWTATHTFQSADSGAGEIVAIDLDRASTTPVANDLLMALRWKMRDAGGGIDYAAKLVAKLLDPTIGNEDAELHFATLVAGTLAARLILGQGLYTPSAAGGDKGVDTINASELYARGNPLGYHSISTQNGTTYTLVQNDLNTTVKFTNGAGCTVTLPSAATVGAGWRVRLWNASGADVIVQRAGTDPIDGGGTAVKVQNIGGSNFMDWWTDGTGWYTSRRAFTSAPQTITSGGALTIAHGLGATPLRGSVRLRCLTAEAGYSINDETFYNLSKADQNATGNHDHALVCDGTNLNVRFGSATNVYGVANKTSGAQSLLTNSNWNVIFHVEY
jgi:hypothetical protein